MIGDGTHIRFASRPAELTRDLVRPRVRRVGLRRGSRTCSTPPTRSRCWSPNLLVEEPDWIHEGVGADVRDDALDLVRHVLAAHH